MRRAALLAVMLLAVAPPDASAADVSRARYLMGTVCEISVDEAAEVQISAAFAEAARVESLLSTWREDTELARLNRSAGEAVSPELFALLQTTMRWRSRTGGAFDPLVAPLVTAWQTRAEGALPDAAVVPGWFVVGFTIHLLWRRS